MESTVLIAEPQEARANQYAHLVRSQGLNPVRAVSGDAAIAQLVRLKPTLLITELSLPGVDGFELLRQAKRLSPRPKTLVISAVREMRDIAAQQRVELGIDGLLATSSPASSIERALRRLLEPEPPPRPSPGSVAPTPPSRSGILHGISLSAPPPSTPPVPTAPTTDGLDLSAVPGMPSEEHLDGILRDLIRRFGVVGALLSFTLRGQKWNRIQLSSGGRWAEEASGEKIAPLAAPVIDAGSPIVGAEPGQIPELSFHPLVREGIMRGYAGIPLQIPGGDVFGAVCLLDERQLDLSPQNQELLKMLARWLSTELTLREELSRADGEPTKPTGGESELQRAASDARAFLGAVVVSSSEGIALFDASRKLIAINEALTQLTGIERNRALGLDMNGWTQAFGALVRDPQRFGWIADGLPAGPFSLREEIELSRPDQKTLRWTARPVRLTGGAFGHVFAYAEVVTVQDVVDDGFDISFLE